MLWKKESTRNETVYVDLFALNGGWTSLNENHDKLRSKQMHTAEKNDDISLQKRQEGNKYFCDHKNDQAMECYNQSLCYAKEESKNISLAYANRSACFLRMKRYIECLNDIELAKESGYPVNLMPKLDRRKEICLKAIKEGTSCAHLDPVLSFETDDQFPGMANVLKITRDANDRLMVIAKEDIDVGQTVVVEEPFIATPFIQNGWKCNVCLKDYMNLVPCNKCTGAMFCSDQCQSNPVHKDECGFKFSNDNVINGFYKHEIRTISTIMNIFSNVDELMIFVEETINSDPNEIPTTLLDEKSKYRAYLKLPIGSDYPFINLTKWAFGIYKTAMDMPKIREKFQSLKYRRFLIHLICQHIQITNNNSNASKLSDEEDLFPEIVSSCTSLMRKYFAQSCAPNMMNVSCTGSQVYATVRPVKKGEQLMHTLFESLLLEPNEKRKERILKDRHYICTCTRCEGHTASQAQRKRLRSDTDFKYIDVNKRLMNWADAIATQEKCVAFLRRYNNVTWCDEIGIVVRAYIGILKKLVCSKCAESFLPESHIKHDIGLNMCANCQHLAALLGA